MRVRSVDTTSRRDVNRFIDLAFALYRDDPLWVPPLRDEVRLCMNRRKHPFYQHSEAEFLLAESEGEPVGRVAIIDNRNYNAYNHSHTALFYLFECIDDGDVARALFDAAAGWARDRGLNRIEGPRGLLAGDGIGLLVEGFQHRPAVGIPYNPPYYDRLLVGCDLCKLTDFYSGYLPGSYELDPRYAAVAERVMARRGLHIKTFGSKRELVAWAPRMREAYNSSFGDGEGHVPLTEA